MPNELHHCNNTTCPYESVIEELKRDAERNSEQHREFYTRFSNAERDIAISEERYNNLLTIITEIKSSVESVNRSLAELRDKPAKKWENVTAYIITCIIGLILGYFFKELI